MKRIKLVLKGILLLAMFVGIIPGTCLQAKEITQEGTTVYDGDASKSYCQVDLSKLEDAEATKLILGANVNRVIEAYEDFYDYDLGVSKDYDSIVSGLPNLTSIEVESGNQELVSIDGVLYADQGKTLTACPVKKEGELTIADGTTMIGRQAVTDCTKLTKITIPASVTQIAKGAFGNNDSCTAFVVYKDNKKYTAVDGVLYTKNKKTLVAYPAGKKTTEFTVPAGVTMVSDAAFYGNDVLKKVSTSTGLKTIRNSAFCDCTALKKVVLKKGVKALGASAFSGAKNLSSVSLPKGLLRIYQHVFYGTKSLTNLSIPESVVSWEIEKDDKLSKKKITVAKYSEVASYLKRLGYKKVSYKKNLRIKKKSKSTKAGVQKGNGKKDTSWYKKGKKTYQISTTQELAGLAKLVNKGVSFAGKKVTLTKDIDLSAYSSWTTIGKSSNKAPKGLYSFDGTFDGKNHVIYNLSCTKWENETGLFGVIGEKGTVKNLTVKNAYIIGQANTGAIAGLSWGTISGCKVYGGVQGLENTGGIVGGSSGSIVKCVSYARVHGSTNVSGIAGSNNGKKKSCKGKGKVTGYLKVRKK